MAMIAPHTGSMIVRHIDKLCTLLYWLTEIRREWKAETIAAGWQVNITLTGIDTLDWEGWVRREAGILQEGNNDR